MNKHSHQLHVLARPFRALLARHHGGAHPTLAAGDSQHPHAHSHHGHGGTGAAATSAARWLLPVLLVAQLMVILDITAVNIALPSLSRDLDISGASISWTITSYTLIFGSLLLFGGRAADLLGRRRVFLTGLAVFTASSLASALAGTATTLFMARAGQGLGAALLSPAALSIIAAADESARRLGSGGRCWRRGRRSRRRPADRDRRLADDLLRQSSGRRRARRGRAQGRTGRHEQAELARP
jgi:hypothetical protein